MDERNAQLQSDAGSAEHDAIARGHEGTAVSIHGIAYTIGGLFIVGILTLIVSWILMNRFARTASKDDPLASPLANQQQAPPAPWLQPSPPQGELRQPWQDMDAYRKHEESELASYRVVDPKRGVVQIPIDRAMLILAAPTAGPASRPTATRPNREPTGGPP